MYDGIETWYIALGEEQEILSREIAKPVLKRGSLPELLTYQQNFCKLAGKPWLMLQTCETGFGAGQPTALPETRYGYSLTRRKH